MLGDGAATVIVINISAIKLAMFGEWCRKISISFADSLYFELQPGQVNWYTRLLLERLGTLSLFETKYDIFLVLYIAMKLIGCLRQR